MLDSICTCLDISLADFFREETADLKPEFKRLLIASNRVFCITSIFKKQRDIIRRKMLRQVLKNAIQLSAIKPSGTAAKKGQTTPVIA